MPVQYQIPPWLGAPADPAQHFGVGMQMGIRLGAEQAAQQFQQQQMLRQQQQDEFERQYKNTVLQMKVDDATRKQSAIANYQQLLSQGMNPMDALRQVGPDMGVSPERIEQIDATRQMRQAQLEATQQNREAMLEQRQLSRDERKREADTREARLQTAARTRVQLAAERAIQTDPALKTLRDTEATLKSTVEGLSGEGYSILSPLRTKSVIQGEIDATNKSLKETQADIAARERAIRSHYMGIAPVLEESTAPDEEEAAPEAAPETSSEPVAPSVVTPAPQPKAPKRLRFNGTGFVEVN